MQHLFFLSGLPRSGSTLLSAILNQHPAIHATATSPLMDLLCETDRILGGLRKNYNLDGPSQEHNLYAALIQGFYAHVSKPIVIDKHRGWPRNVPALARFVMNPKIICTVRPIAEIITSYVKLIEAHPERPNFVDNALAERGQPKTTPSRAKLIWEEYVRDPYDSLRIGLESSRAQLLLVPYDDLVTNPRHTMASIYQFTGIPPFFDFDLSRLKNTSPERDQDAWGLHGLHDIRPTLGATSTPPEQLLGAELTQYFAQFDIHDAPRVSAWLAPPILNPLSRT